MKKITTAEVMRAFRENPSAEPEGENITYYLHITNAGDIVGCAQDAAETFTVSVDLNAYLDIESEDEYEEKYGSDWGAACAAREDDADSEFPQICEQLAAQANSYLETSIRILTDTILVSPLMPASTTPECSDWWTSGPAMRLRICSRQRQRQSRLSALSIRTTICETWRALWTHLLLILFIAT
mgnify:CR=1 FL=1